VRHEVNTKGFLRLAAQNSTVLLSYGKWRLKMAKAKFARAAFPIVKGKRERGIVVIPVASA
jgi:hypothetical protein